jgi:hypothetical protein
MFHRDSSRGVSPVGKMVEYQPGEHLIYDLFVVR